MAFAPVSNGRLLPTNHHPGPVTAALKAKPGEIGTDVLERVGAAIMPADPNPQPLSKAQRRAKKLPRQLAAIVGCRTEGMSDKEIAIALNISCSSVRNILARARKQMGLSDIVDRVEHRAVHTAVDNLIDGLDGKKGPETEETYTLATLKGVGVFRQHSAVKQETTETINNELRVVIEMPELPAGAALPQIAIGSVVGLPKNRALIEGDLIDAVP